MEKNSSMFGSNVVVHNISQNGGFLRFDFFIYLKKAIVIGTYILL